MYWLVNLQIDNYIFLNVASIQNYIDKAGAFGFTKAKTNVVYSEEILWLVVIIMSKEYPLSHITIN